MRTRNHPTDTDFTMPRGILRNKDEAKPHPFEENLDRSEVIRNTVLNSKMHSDPTKPPQPDSTTPGENPDHLKWDEINLYKTEQEKAATMKIDEPKTPYEGGFNPEGEYYQEDVDEDIPQFELGKGEAEDAEQSLNGGRILRSESPEEEEEEEEVKPLTAEERHKKFEEKRAAHYHMKAKPLSRDYDYTKEPEE